MGLRGELFSTRVMLQNRSYFFNVKENRVGDLYLNIVESKNRDEGGFERQSVILFAEDLQEFLKGFDDALRVLEKSVREKRRGAPNRGGSERKFRDDDQSPRPPRQKREYPSGDEDKPRRGSKFSGPPERKTGGFPERKTGRPPARGTGKPGFEKKRPDYKSEGKPDFSPRKKRVVVKRDKH